MVEGPPCEKPVTSVRGSRVTSRSVASVWVARMASSEAVTVEGTSSIRVRAGSKTETQVVRRNDCVPGRGKREGDQPVRALGRDRGHLTFEDGRTVQPGDQAQVRSAGLGAVREDDQAAGGRRVAERVDRLVDDLDRADAVAGVRRIQPQALQLVDHLIDIKGVEVQGGDDGAAPRAWRPRRNGRALRRRFAGSACQGGRHRRR